MTAVTAYLGLGANLGCRDANLREAVARLEATPGIAVLRVSSIYETEPVGLKEQPWFLNGVVEVAVTLGPEALLERILAIEAALGRVRCVRWGPRPIDIDILLYGNTVVNRPGLRIPHPGLKERAFVLLPLHELVPDLVLPDGEPLAAMVARLDRAGGPRVVKRRGYSLAAAPDLLLPAEIRRGLNTRVLGREIHHFHRVTSTQEVARELAARGAPAGTVVVAEAQTAGRGRRGRGWVSPPGAGVWLSVILRPDLSPAQVPLLTLAAGVAAVRAIGEAAGVAPGLKWPNDLLIRGRKLGGILAEMAGQPEGVGYVILGVGINVGVSPDQLPPELVKRTTSLRRVAGRELSRVDLCRRLLASLEAVCDQLAAGESAAVLDAWRRASVTLGRRVSVVLPGEIVTGRALDVTPDGGLVLALPGGGTRVFLAGEVSLRRPANDRPGVGA